MNLKIKISFSSIFANENNRIFFGSANLYNELRPLFVKIGMLLLIHNIGN